MNTQTQDPQNSARESLPSAIVDLGSAWARYGLRLGSAALEANAKHVETYGKVLGEALASTAKALDNLANTFQKKAPEAAAPERDGVVTEAAPRD